MGKKSRKAKLETKEKTEVEEKEEEAPSSSPPVVWKNPDGSKTMFIAGELAFIGGQTRHIGHAALPPGSAPYKSRHSLYGAKLGERQSASMKALAEAFHRKYTGEEVDPMAEACLTLEGKIGVKGFVNGRGGPLKFSKTEINESVIMSTHRWIVTVLPIDVVKKVGQLALVYRNAVKRYDDLLKMNHNEEFPTPALAFGALDCVTESNRPEVIALLNAVFKLPFSISAYIYSEKDDDIYCFMKDFVRSEKGLVNLPKDATSSDILEYIHSHAGMMETTRCFWCEKTKMTTKKLFLCTPCMSVSYCSKECQKYDWKSFHKSECALLKEVSEGDPRQKKRDDLGMAHTRSDTLRKPGKMYPRVPMLIARADDEENVFRGDALTGYVTGCVENRLTEKTKIFPLGLQVLPREETTGDAAFGAHT